MPEKTLQQKEAELAYLMDTSATTSNAARLILGLPKDVKGLSFLDLAAGASPLSASLIADGAIATALDPLYGKPWFLMQKIHEALPKIIARVPKENQSHMRNVTNSAIGLFLESFRANRVVYKDGWMSQLPFEADTFDWTVSLYGMSYLAESPQLLDLAMDQALKVTKKGGKVVMAPFHTPKGFNRIYSDQHKYLVDSLMTQGFECKIENNIPGYLDSRLTIIK